MLNISDNTPLILCKKFTNIGISPKKTQSMYYGVYMKFPKKVKAMVKETLIGKYPNKNTANDIANKFKKGYTSKFNFEVKEERK